VRVVPAGKLSGSELSRGSPWFAQAPEPPPPALRPKTCGPSKQETAPWPCRRWLLLRRAMGPEGSWLAPTALWRNSCAWKQKAAVSLAVVEIGLVNLGIVVKEVSSLANAAENPRQKRVPLSALLLMNQRHEFPTMDTPAVSSSKRVPQQQQYDPATSNAKLVLEDGITCKYDSPLTKAKMAHIALALSPLLEAIGEELASSNAATATAATKGGRREGGEGEAVTFAKHGVSGTQGTPKLRALRLRCIVAIRACLDLDTFQRRKGSGSSKSGAAAADNEPRSVRGRDRRRYCKDDAGQFMCFGEGHCHTVSSVMAAALLPFTEVLSVDLRYREDQGGHHQWLEFTLLGPANPETFVCDLYREHTARLMRGAGEGRGIKRSIGKGRREERKEGEIDRSNGFVDEVLVQPIATAYDSWMGANCHGLVPAPFLKVLTGRPIRAAALEDGDVLFVTPPLCSST